MTNSNTITVPSSAVATTNYNSPVAAEGKEWEKIPAKAGDPVEFSVKGSVESIDDAGNAVVRIAFINGERLEAAPADQETDTPADDAGPTEDDVRAMAAKADQASGADSYI